MATSPKTCSVEGCERRRFGLGLCNAHYLRQRRHGNPLGGGATPQKQASVCSIDGCEKPPYAFSLCSAHYTRAYRHEGNPLGGGTDHGAAQRFLSDNVAHSDTVACLPWPYVRDHHGYGLVTFRGRQTTANFVMCTLAHGEPPTSKHQSAHSCGRGHEGCVNPHHLRWATSAQNHADKLLHGTHSRGERAAGAKLTEQQVKRIRNADCPQKELSAQYGVKIATISAVQRRKNWAWLPEEASL